MKKLTLMIMSITKFHIGVESSKTPTKAREIGVKTQTTSKTLHSMRFKEMLTW